MRRYVDLDFETMSSDDLKLVGAAAYSECPTTEVLCLCYDTEGVTERWLPGGDTARLHELANDPEVIFVAHSAGFEQVIWRSIMVPDFGLPPLPPERWEDTMATCAWKTLPLKLEKAASALRLPVEKDMEGNRLTLGMSRINKKTGMYPERTPETLERITDYCAQDVAVEGQVRHRIGLLSEQSPHERGIWLLDQKINQRGVKIDLDFVRQAQRVVDRATGPLLAEFRELTGGINPSQRDRVIGWAGAHGVELENLQKGYLEELLGDAEYADDAGYISNAADDDGADVLLPVGLPDTVRRVLEIRQMLGSSSIKKLSRMRACVCADGRARGLLQYHAASPGRWGGRLFQPQNFPRGTIKVSPDEAVEAIMTGDPRHVELVLGAPAIECVASSLRHALVADAGRVFLVGDFAGVEARIVLALAGQTDKTALMAAGHDVYLDMASTIYGEPVTKDDKPRRQAGKAAVLGAGFQMGAERFQYTAAKRYGVTLTLEQAEATIHAYRREWAPKVPPLWYALEDTALKAVEHGRAEAYGVVYQREGDFLTATPPSGWQKLWYYQPVWHPEGKFGKPFWAYQAYKGGRMSHRDAYGGLLTENAVQGLARGLLCASMMRVERAGMPIVLTVHDEIVAEVDEDKADLDVFEELMAEPTSWASRIGVPVAVEAWQGERYRK